MVNKYFQDFLLISPVGMNFYNVLWNNSTAPPS